MAQLILNIETPTLEMKIRNMLKGMIGVHVSSSTGFNEISDKTSRFLSQFDGKWCGNETAEDIIKTIDDSPS